MNYDFTIYGSGISAKLTSLALAKQDFNVCLISDVIEKTEKTPGNNLVTFLSSGSLNYLSTIISEFNRFKDFNEISQIRCKLDNLSIGKDKSISFYDKENRSFGKIIRNSNIEECINDDLKKLKNFNVLENSEITDLEFTDNGIILSLDNKTKITSELFIATSKKNKNVLDVIKVNFITKNFNQTALSISLEGHLKNKNCAFQKFTSHGPLALLPYKEKEASVVWSLKNNSKYLLESDEKILDIIKEILCDHLEITKLIDLKKYELHFSHAKKLFYKNAILIGNLAHNIHPIAGQGLNLTIKDIAKLSTLTSQYRKIGYKINDQSVIEKFNQERKLDNTIYSFGTFTLEGILSSKNKTLNFLTGYGLDIIQNNNMMKNLFVASATGRKFFKSL